MKSAEGPEDLLGSVYFSGILTLSKMWRCVRIWCSSNTLKSSQILFPKIFYHDEDFLN
jgi:hypothetical protein